jgi:hypothetical protein
MTPVLVVQAHAFGWAKRSFAQGGFLMEKMWSNMKIATNRRSFLKNGLAAAGVATAGMGLVTENASALADEPDHAGAVSVPEP